MTISVLALAVLAVKPGQAAIAADEIDKSATNLLTNPNFDTDITGWTLSGGNASWDPSRDADGNPHSGSLQISFPGSPQNYNSSNQCVAVTPGTYALSGKIFAPAGTYPAGSNALLRLIYYPSTDCSGSPGGVAFSPGVDLNTTQNTWVSGTAGPLVAPPGTRSALISLLAETASTAGTVTANFDDLVFKAAVGTCVASSTTLCIADTPGDYRFAVVASFATSEGGGHSGSGEAIPLASLGVTHGGLFWFFSADNPEMLIKVLNACTLNQKYWVFFAAVTNVGFTVTVTDTVTGHQKMYHNPDLQAAGPVQDTSALPCN